MAIRLPSAVAALCAVLLWASTGAEVAPPSDLKFEIINENSVRMSWQRSQEYIEGYRITVVPTTDGPTKELTLPYTATQTVLTELVPDIEYVVTIISFDDAEESLPVFGQLTIQTGGPLRPGDRKPGETGLPRCSLTAVADVVFLVDGSWSVGRSNFKYILDFITGLVSAFEIGEDKTRVGVVQYSSDTRAEFHLNQYLQRNDLLSAIKRIPYKGGNTMTGDAIDYLISNTFTESSGARKGFPKVAIIITDGKSQDDVEIPARELRNLGVEVFTLGIKAADAKELKQMASLPSLKHVYNVANFDAIVDVQNEIITQVCASVDEQLSELVSGEEAVEPPSNLIVTEVGSKSMRLKWRPSPSQITGYRVQMIPMIAGSKQHSLNVGPQTTSINMKDLSPDTEYQINVFAMKELTASEPLTTMEKTEAVKVQVECSGGQDIKADVVLLVDGSYSIGIANFAKVRSFLEVLVKSFDVSPERVQISLVQYSRDPYTEFTLNKYDSIDDILKAVNTFPYRGGSTNTAGVILGGAYLYKYFGRSRYFCGVEYLEDDMTLTKQYADSSTARYRSIEENIQIFEEENVEFISVPVPEFANSDPADIVHDFQRKLTAYLDLALNKCYVIPLNTTIVMPPKNFMELLNNIKAGTYLPQSYLIHEQMVVTDRIENVHQLGDFIERLCRDKETYKLQRRETVQGIQKRSAVSCHKIRHFENTFVVETEICEQE